MVNVPKEPDNVGIGDIRRVHKRLVPSLRKP